MRSHFNVKKYDIKCIDLAAFNKDDHEGLWNRWNSFREKKNEGKSKKCERGMIANNERQKFARSVLILYTALLGGKSLGRNQFELEHGS